MYKVLSKENVKKKFKIEFKIITRQIFITEIETERGRKREKIKIFLHIHTSNLAKLFKRFTVVYYIYYSVKILFKKTILGLR